MCIRDSYRVYSQPQTSFWCCVGSGMENHARYGEMIYGHKDHSKEGNAKPAANYEDEKKELFTFILYS